MNDLAGEAAWLRSLARRVRRILMRQRTPRVDLNTPLGVRVEDRSSVVTVGSVRRKRVSLELWLASEAVGRDDFNARAERRLSYFFAAPNLAVAREFAQAGAARFGGPRFEDEHSYDTAVIAGESREARYFGVYTELGPPGVFLTDIAFFFDQTLRGLSGTRQGAVRDYHGFDEWRRRRELSGQMMPGRASAVSRFACDRCYGRRRSYDDHRMACPDLLRDIARTPPDDLYNPEPYDT
jgi:hypothetical protein